MILVTGGAGFIGANFILDWCADGDEPIVNLDKLTYAGNLGNLASLTVFLLSALVVVPVLSQAPEDVVRFFSGADDVLAVSLSSILCVALGTLIATPDASAAPTAGSPSARGMARGELTNPGFFQRSSFILHPSAVGLAARAHRGGRAARGGPRRR